MIVDFLLFAAAVIGMTHIIVDPAVIAKPLRDWLAKNGSPFINKIVSCYQCCGFYVGMLMGAILLTHKAFTIGMPSVSFEYPLVGVFWVVALLIQYLLLIIAYGMAGSFLATWGATYFIYLEAQSIVNMDENENG